MSIENINDRLLLYIRDNSSNGWTVISDFLKKENRGDTELKYIIRGLIDSKLISVKGDRYRQLGSSSSGHRFTIDNVTILARLLPNGEERLDDLKRKEKPTQVVNIGGDNKGQISQIAESDKVNINPQTKSDSVIKQTLIGLLVTVLGGLILYWIVKELI